MMQLVVTPLKNKRVAEKKNTEKRQARGRPSMFESNKAIAAVLRGEVKVTRFHMVQLVEKGYLKAVPLEKEAPRRGRRSYGYELTLKGKGLVALSKNWFGKHKDEAATVCDISDDALVTASEIIESNDDVSENDVIEAVNDADQRAEEFETILASEAAEDDMLPIASNDDKPLDEGWDQVSA